MDTVVPSLGGDPIEDTSSEPTLLSEPKEEVDVFGEPELLPRVGEEYQVALPELVSRSEYVKQLRCEVTDEEVANDISSELPLSVAWVQSPPNCDVCEPVDSKGKFSSAVNDESTNRIGSIPVPGALYSPWSETEEEVFLLGLYILGRNFLLVKKFVGSNNIGEVLSHYYGKFYRSERYQTWLDCRKTRGRKCACGLKIFIGSRQQELLSRLLPQLSEEGQNKLLEVSETFSLGKMLLEEYVMTLKDIVGLHNLVEAVGIGKGKKDLTRTVLEKSNRATHIQPRWPTRRACSALSLEEILTYLRGGAPLSKARSNDLFWEAVWPRLLAKGWHSEQPRNGFFSKEYLVFLVPGVKKFSRRNLMKGQHYFDCVRDVLNKVASDPRILDLNGESGEGYGVEEANSDREKSRTRDQRSYLKPRTQSRGGKEDTKFTIIDTTEANGETRKLRVMRGLPVECTSVQFGSHLAGAVSMEVETNAGVLSSETNYLSFNMVEADISNSVNVISLEKHESPVNSKAVIDSLNGAIRSNREGLNDNEGKPTTKCERKPRKKPDEKNSLAPEGRKRQKMNLSSDNQMGSVIAVGTVSEKEETTSRSSAMVLEKESMVIDGKSETNHKPQSSMFIDSLNGAVQSERQGSKDDEGKPTIKCQQRTGRKPDERSCRGPEAGKRRKMMKISSDNQMGRCSTVGKEMKPQFEKEETNSCSGTSTVENENMVIGGENETNDKPRTPVLFDLNLPPMQDPEIIESGNVGMSMEQHNQSNKQDSVLVAANGHPHPTNSEPQPSTSTRRQSGRNRLMSTRALEAIASDLMATEARQRR